MQKKDFSGLFNDLEALARNAQDCEPGMVWKSGKLVPYEFSRKTVAGSIRTFAENLAAYVERGHDEEMEACLLAVSELEAEKQRAGNVSIVSSDLPTFLTEAVDFLHYALHKVGEKETEEGV